MGPFLFVGGDEVSMYALGSSKPLRSVRVNEYVSSVQLALDSHGHLCLANGDISYPQIFEFDARTLDLMDRVYGDGDYPALLAGRLGYLYASTSGPVILVYAPGCTRIANTIHLGEFDGSGAMVFDRSGNLYVGTQPHAVSVFAPTRRPGHVRLVRQIRDGINHVTALAMGPSDDLFVGNYKGKGDGYVTVYPRLGLKPTLKITKGVGGINALAVDSKGRLYVAIADYRVPSGWVSVYAPGGTKPVRKLHIFNPLAFAIDPSDNLYVLSPQPNAVFVYNPGATKLLRKITAGVDVASGLVIGSP